MLRVSGCLIATILTFAAHAQEEDSEGVSIEPQCELSANWRVIAKEIGEIPGMTMDVNKRNAGGQPDCKTENVQPDFVAGGPDQALWLTKLTGDYLVMARSTGPVGSVVVQNLTDKTIVVDVPSVDSQADSWGVTYWQQKEAGTADNCPQFAEYKEQGFGAVISHEMRYDFASKAVLTSGQTSCEPLQ